MRGFQNATCCLHTTTTSQDVIIKVSGVLEIINNFEIEYIRCHTLYYILQTKNSPSIYIQYETNTHTHNAWYIPTYPSLQGMHMEQKNNFNSQWHKHTSNPHPQHHYSTHYSESLLPSVEYSSVCVQAARTCGPNSLIMVMMWCLLVVWRMKCGAVCMADFLRQSSWSRESTLWSTWPSIKLRSTTTSLSSSKK